MGLLRYGDTLANPDTDVMIKRGIRYELDSVWTSRYQARSRESQLETNGKTVYVLDRMAPPEEVNQHMHTRGIPELGEEAVHLDGRFTPVYEVWVAVGRTYRKKVTNNPKPKRKTVKKTCRCKS